MVIFFRIMDNPSKSNNKKKDSRLRSSAFDSAYEGPIRPLPENSLPTFKDVGLAVEFHKYSNMSESCAISQVVKDIESVYDHASIPIHDLKYIRNKVKNINVLRKKRLKEMVINKKKEKPIVIGKFKKKHKNGKDKVKLQEVLNKLFLVANEDNIPNIEKEFYEDQKGERKMIIGGTDHKESNKRMRKILRQQKEYERFEKEKDSANATESYEQLSECDSSVGDENIDEFFQESSPKRSKYGKLDMESVTLAIEEGERAGLSDDVIANMYNASNKNSECVLIQSQVNRIRNKLREKKVEESKGKSPVAVGMDERKDATKVAVGVGSKGKERYEIHKVENCSIIYWEESNGEVKSEYVGHVSPGEGTGKGLACAVFKKGIQISAVCPQFSQMVVQK